MPPLPPRPDKPVEVKAPSILLERTQLEQQAGQETLKLSKTRHEEEQEAGKAMVELNKQRASQK